ncbi:hypothetical protein K2X05_07885 [bacterium]|nr:hypothetical protein [bacterium]
MNVFHSIFSAILILLPLLGSAAESDTYFQSEGVSLEYPQGRFQENAAPMYFKWNLRTKTASIALKVFRCEGVCSPTVEKQLVARFDFMPDVQSMNWFGEALPIGNYVWTVEAFNKSNPGPIFSDTAYFSIESMMSFSLKTDRLGLLVGFARGSYGSIDANYELDFQTTPTIYGLNYGGGSTSAIWNVKAFVSDFVLRGQVYKTTNVGVDYLFELNSFLQKKMYVFFGPSLKYFNYPQVISPNGTDVSINNEWVVSPGLSFKTEYCLDKYLSAQFGVSYDVPSMGSQDVNSQFKNGSLNTSLGLNYGKIWPVGLGAEIQYQKDRISTRPQSSTQLDINQSQWIFLFQVFYAL